MSGNTSHGNYGRLCQIVDLCEAVAIFCIVGVDQNFFVLFFKLMVAKCFYLSGDLFPGFGYGKPKCVFTII